MPILRLIRISPRHLDRNTLIHHAKKVKMWLNSLKPYNFNFFFRQICLYLYETRSTSLLLEMCNEPNLLALRYSEN